MTGKSANPSGTYLLSHSFCAQMYGCSISGFSGIHPWGLPDRNQGVGGGLWFSPERELLYPSSRAVGTMYFLVAVEPSSRLSSGYQLETSLSSSRVSTVPCHVASICSLQHGMLVFLQACWSVSLRFPGPAGENSPFKGLT